MKKIMLLLATIAFLMATVMGCSQSNDKAAETTQEATWDESTEVYVSIDAYSFDAMLSYVDSMFEDQAEQCETMSLSLMGYRGQTIAQALEMSKMSELAVVCETDVFEGWMVYKQVITVDEDGWENYSYEKISGDKLYTTEEMLADQLKDYSVTYVAKWESVPDSEYYDMYEAVWDEDGESYYLSMYSNGGGIFFESDPTDGMALIGSQLTAGDTIANVLGDAIVSVEKEGATFAGWMIYTATDYDNVEEEVTDLAEDQFLLSLGDYGYQLLYGYEVCMENATTEELEGIVCEDLHYFAVPVWE